MSDPTMPSFPKPEAHDCRKCAHFWMGSEPSYCTDWIGDAHECTAIPHMANIKSFPFKNTKCAKFKAHATNQEQLESKS